MAGPPWSRRAQSTVSSSHSQPGPSAVRRSEPIWGSSATVRPKFSQTPRSTRRRARASSSGKARHRFARATRETGSQWPIVRATWPPRLEVAAGPSARATRIPTRSAVASTRSRKDGLGASTVKDRLVFIDLDRLLLMAVWEVSEPTSGGTVYNVYNSSPRCLPIILLFQPNSRADSRLGRRQPKHSRAAPLQMPQSKMSIVSPLLVRCRGRRASTQRGGSAPVPATCRLGLPDRRRPHLGPRPGSGGPPAR
jgi:hypothetical protein